MMNDANYKYITVNWQGFFPFSNFYLNAPGRSTNLTLESLTITILRQKNPAGPNLKNLRILKVKPEKVIFNVFLRICYSHCNNESFINRIIQTKAYVFKLNDQNILNGITVLWALIFLLLQISVLQILNRFLFDLIPLKLGYQNTIVAGSLITKSNLHGELL